MHKPSTSRRAGQPAALSTLDLAHVIGGVGIGEAMNGTLGGGPQPCAYCSARAGKPVYH